jgi:hypothetical protein
MSACVARWNRGSPSCLLTARRALPRRFRRHILSRAPEYVRPGGTVLLQWLSYYGVGRALGVCAEPGARVAYEGLAHSSDWVPLWPPHQAPAIAAALDFAGDQRDRIAANAAANAAASGTATPPLLPPSALLLEQYAAAEARGALPYECGGGAANDAKDGVAAAVTTTTKETGGRRRGGGGEGAVYSATEMLRRVRAARGQPPLCRWQVHRFRVTA